jgi:PKD repeat protein
MKKNLLFLIAVIVLCSAFDLDAQLFRKRPTFDYADPNENFYVTQKRFQKYYKEHEKEETERILNRGKNSKIGDEEEEELAGYELYKRWETYMAPRVYPSGDKTLASKAYEEYMNYISQNASQKTGPNSIMSTTWQPIGPMGDLSGANAGRINGVRFDPYWACAPDGGLWKTTNSGSTWSTNTDALTAIGCSDVCFDPTNAQNMWMASGDGDAGDCYSLGVLKSTNGGLTWSATGLAWTVNQGRRIFKLIINPLNKNTLFAATSIGLYRTLNGGTSWSLVSPATTIYDVEYKPGDTTTVYCCSNAFYQSTNGGTSFTNITSGLPTSGVERMAIAVTPANATYVYVVCSSSANSGFLGFWQSTTSGTSFVSKATTPNLLGWASAGNDTGGQGWYTLSIAASPTNANEVCVGGVNIWRTTNGGTNWSLFAHWTGSGAPYVHADIHDIIYKNGTSIYIACDGGAFYTTNSGSTFFSMNGNMNIAQIYKIGLSSTTYSRAITGHQDNGTNIFNGGWIGTMGGDGMDCFIDRTNDNVMYGEQYSGSFNRTTNGGGSWTAITTGMTGTGGWVTPWHQDPVVANTLYGGRQQMFKSTNQGTNWAQIGTLGGSGSIVEFAVAPSNTQVIYVIKGNALYKTTNGGGTWTAITGSLPVGSAQMTSIVVEDVDANSAWVTFSGYSTGNKIYQTTNGGTTWTNYSTGLPNLPCNRVVYWNGTQDGLYVGMDVGVYYRDSTMSTWVNYSNGLPNVIVSDLAIFYPLGKLRAATYGRSVYEVDLYNTGNLAPIANFTSDKQYICPTMTVNFTDQSSFVPTSWSWLFQGGTPATSTLQNPSIVYNTAGTYSVQLTATNVNGSSVMTKTLYITVTSPTTIPMVEGFQGATFPPLDWQNYDAGSNTLIWTKSTTVGKASTASLFFDNYNLDVSGTRDEFRSPKYNLVGWTNAKCYFDVAYARYDATYSDSLEVLVSTNCGLTYTSLYLKGGTTLATAPDKTSSIFVPTSTQWRTDTVYLNAYSGMGNVMVSFKNRGRYGQALYIDNINISATAASMPPTASFSYAAASLCSGQNIYFSDMSTNAPTAWSWTLTGATPSVSSVKNPTVSYASGGTYTITLVSSNSIGSSSPVSQVITVNATPTVAATSALATICNGQSVLLTGSGASTYSWNTGPTTNTISVAPTSNTTYSVIGTTGSCSNTAMVSVTVNPSPTVSVNSATVCAGSTATLTASGATTYSWSTGSTSTSISVSPTVTTVYTITGTSAGCSNAKTSTVTANPLPTVSVNNATVCSGSPTGLTASGASTYSWSTGSTSVSITVNPTVTTVYTVTGTSGGCSSAKTSTVSVNALPSVGASATSPTVCSGNSTNLIGSGASTYTWNPGAMTGASVAVSPTANTTYSCIGTGTNGCTNSATLGITVNTLPTVSSNSAVICAASGSATLTASGATSYSWSTGSSATSIVVTPTVTTNYIVTGTNAAGCSKSYTTQVQVVPSPTVAVNSATICPGAFANLTASGASTYSWSTGSTSTSISVSPSVTTVYTITGSSGSCNDVKKETVSVSALPSINASSSASAICSGQSANLSASGGTSYTWNPGAMTGASVAVSPTTGITYSCIGTGTNGCSNTATLALTVNSLPAVSSTSAISCASGGSATLTASGATSYSWSTGATSTSIVVSPSVTTNYIVTGTNSAGCSKSYTTQVQVVPNPTVTVNSATICPGGSTNLTASGATTYSWSTGSTSTSISVSPTVTTVYTVTGTSGTCNDAKTSTVTIAPLPVISAAASASAVCAGQSSTLTGSGGTSYTWNPGAITGNPIAVSPASSITYSCTGTGTNGCTSNPVAVSISVTPAPSVSISAASNTACTGSTGGTTVALTGSPSGGVYSGTGVVGNTFTTQTTAGNYVATYSYTDVTTGCSNSAAFTITVNVCTGVAQVAIDGDGNISVIPNPNNGLFTIKSTIMENYEVTIYNTIGQLIKTLPPTNKSVNVDLSTYGSGVYNVVFKIGDAYKTVKVIVE